MQNRVRFVAGNLNWWKIRSNIKFSVLTQTAIVSMVGAQIENILLKDGIEEFMTANEILIIGFISIYVLIFFFFQKKEKIMDDKFFIFVGRTFMCLFAITIGTRIITKIVFDTPKIDNYLEIAAIIGFISIYILIFYLFEERNK